MCVSARSALNSGIEIKQSNLLVHVQLAEDLGRIQEVLVLVDPVERAVVLVGLHHGGAGRTALLLSVERQQRQVQDDGDPVAIDDEQEGQESVNGGLGHNVGVEAVAEVNGVDVVTAGANRDG